MLFEFVEHIAHVLFVDIHELLLEALLLVHEDLEAVVRHHEQLRTH